MKLLKRLVAHTVTTPLSVRYRLPTSTLESIKHFVRECELTHGGQIVLAVEPALALSEVLAGRNGRERAVQVFSELGVWDTEHNNGVLLYLLFADHNIEIVVDRGLAAHIGGNEWEQVCVGIEDRLRRGEFEQGLRWGIREISALTARHFPPVPGRVNELADKPHVL